MIRYRYVLAAVGFILIAGLVGQSDYEDALMEEQKYCEMVNEYDMSNGERGWPDYKDIYDSACAKYAFAG